MRKSCVIYAAWADQIINMSKDLAGEYVQAILKYAIYGEDIKPDNELLNAMLIPVKKKLDEDLEKYEAKVDRAKSLSKRNHNEVGTKSERNQNDVEGVTVTDTDTVTVTDTDKYKKKRSVHDYPERTYDFEKLKADANVR